MSLVHEALRKAEREKQRKTGVPPPPAPASPQIAVSHKPGAAIPLSPARQHEPARTEPQRSYYGLFLALTSCVALVAIVAVVFLVSRALVPPQGPGQPAGVAALPGGNPVTPVASGTDAAAPTRPPSAAPDASAFAFTGTVTNPDATMSAIINGNLYSVGDHVNGATVKSIERDRVTLEIPGQPETVLRLF